MITIRVSPQFRVKLDMIVTFHGIFGYFSHSESGGGVTQSILTKFFQDDGAAYSLVGKNSQQTLR